MKSRFHWSSTIALCLFLLPSLYRAGAEVRVYPAPAGEPLSTRFTVSVNNLNAPVYKARVRAIAQVQPETIQDGEADFASFDMNSPVQVTITCPQAVQQVKVLPSIRGIVPRFSGQTITLTVDKQGPLTVEVNGDWMNSLHLFADPVETNIPKQNDPNVIYFGPGVHTIDGLTVGSGKTIYVAGGAVVYGKPIPGKTFSQVFGLEGSNIILRGRGIIDGSLFPPHTGNIVEAHGSNILVEGVVLRDSPDWTFQIHDSNQVKVEGVKEFGWRGNSDGIDINNSSQVDVHNVFVRTYDDLIVIKTKNPTGQPSQNITVEHAVLWNSIAHALSIGAEIREDVSGVTFSDCDIIHDKGREWLLRVFNSGAGTVSHVTFENIRIEEARRLYSVWVGKNVWSKDAEQGHVSEVQFRDISAPAPQTQDKAIELTSFDAQHGVSNVHFNNVRVNGRQMQAADVKQTNPVSNLDVRPTSH